MRTRRRFLAAATVGLTAAPAILRAQTLVPVRASSAPDDDVSSVLYAIDAGMFRKAGLDVTITRGNSGAAVGAAVAGGAIDVGKSSLVSLISAHVRNIPFVLVAGAALYTAERPVVAMLGAKDGTVASARDLPGKTVAVPALNDLDAIATAAFVDGVGGNWHDIRYVELPGAASPEALIAHRIDAVTVTTPVLTIALDGGKIRLVGYPFSAIAKRFVQAAWFTSRDYAVKNADVIARFRRVVTEAAAVVNARPALSAPALAAFSKLDVAIIARMPRATAVGPIDAALVQPVIDAAAKYGAIVAPFDARELIATV